MIGMLFIERISGSCSALEYEGVVGVAVLEQRLLSHYYLTRAPLIL